MLNEIIDYDIINKNIPIFNMIIKKTLSLEALIFVKTVMMK